MPAEQANRIYRKHLAESAGRAGEGELCTGGPGPRELERGICNGGPRPGDLEQREYVCTGGPGPNWLYRLDMENRRIPSSGRQIQMGAGEQLSLVFSGRNSLNLFIYSQLPTPNL